MVYNNWFEVKEKSAGEKRLFLTFYLYKIFGKNIAYLIAFFVGTITYILNSDIRFFTKKYFKTLFEYTKCEKLKPSFLNSIKLILNYSYSLVDKMLVINGDIKTDELIFKNETEKDSFLNYIKEKRGIVVIFNHIGNIDIFRAILSDDKFNKPKSVSVLLQKEHCSKFRNFLKQIQKGYEFKLYPVEDININTALELEEDINQGGIIFIAGDRIAKNNPLKTYEVNFLGKKAEFPVGTFKIAKIMKAPVFFISVVKQKGKFEIYIKEEKENLKESFIEFTQNITLLYPYQFFHFYDFFKE